MGSVDPSGDLRKRRTLARFWPEWPVVALSAGLATAAAFAEAAGLILVVSMAEHFGAGDAAPLQLELGPMSLELTLGQAAAVSAAAVMLTATVLMPTFWT